MTTGDIQNNLRKLKSHLKHVSFPHDPDYDRLSRGCADAFLPIYHHLMVDFSQPFARRVADMGVEFLAKTDLRFIEAMYKVLRELFSYKPPLTQSQFFANGFAERKVIMCTEILSRMRDWHKQHGDKSSKTKPSSASSKMGPRATAAPSGVAKPTVSKRPDLELGTTDAASSSGKEASGGPVITVHRNAPGNRVPSADTPALKPLLGTQPHVHVSDIEVPRPRVEPKGHPTTDVYEHPRVSCQKVATVEVRNLARDEASLSPPSVLGGELPLMRPIDVVAQTPGRHSRPETDLATHHRIVALEQTVRELNARVVSLESEVESLRHSRDTPAVQGPTLPPQQLENILARLLLLENSTAMMEKRVNTSTARSLNEASGSTIGYSQSSSGFHGNVGFLGSRVDPAAVALNVDLTSGAPSSSSTAGDRPHELRVLAESAQPMPSPIPLANRILRHTYESPDVIGCQDTENQPPSKLTSTPLEMTHKPEDDGLHSLAKDQATRIKQMLKETENLLNIEVLSPVKPTKPATLPVPEATT